MSIHNGRLNKKIDREIIVAVGTDIPPMSGREFNLYVSLIDAGFPVCSNLDTVFQDFTLCKRGRFDILSRLKKLKVISVIKNGNDIRIDSIPSMTITDAEKVVMYKPTNRREHHEILKNL